MKLLISSFFSLIFISTSAHAGNIQRRLVSLFEEPFVQFIIAALLMIIFVAALSILMLSTLLCIVLIGFILFSIFFSEKNTPPIENFLFLGIGTPPIKKFLFGRMNGDEFKEHSIALFLFTILFLFGFLGLDLWINLFNYQSSFLKNAMEIFGDYIFGNESGFDDKSIIGSKNIFLIFCIIIPYFLIGLISFIRESAQRATQNISENEKRRNRQIFYSYIFSIFSRFFSFMYSEKPKKKDDIESRLEKLKKLLDDNLIFKEEYEEQRKKIIGDV
jgi:hypothetical protein